MRRTPHVRGLLCVLAALAITAAACGDDDTDTAGGDTAEAAADATDTTMAGGADTGDEAAALPEGTAEICDADQLVEAVENGPEEGTLAGMTDDPVGTAASSNPC